MLKNPKTQAQTKISTIGDDLEAFYRACYLNRVNNIINLSKKIFSAEISIDDLVRLDTQDQEDHEHFFAVIFDSPCNIMAQYFVLNHFFSKSLLPKNKFHPIKYLDLLAEARSYAGLAATWIYFNHLSQYHCEDFSAYEAGALRDPAGNDRHGRICLDLKGEPGKRHIDAVIARIEEFNSKKSALDSELENAEVAHNIPRQLDCQIKLAEHWMTLANEDLNESFEAQSLPGASFSCWKASSHIEAAASLLRLALASESDLDSSSLQSCYDDARQLSQLITPIVETPTNYCLYNSNIIYPEINQCHNELKTWFTRCETRQEALLSASAHRTTSNGKTRAFSLASVWNSSVTIWQLCFRQSGAPAHSKKAMEAQAASETKVVTHNDAAYPNAQKMHHRR
jgi:hypothetical protein